VYAYQLGKITSEDIIACNADARGCNCKEKQQPGGGASHVDDASFIVMD
jgi:hypothetical protein